MCLRAPLNRRDSYRPPPDVLEEYWRGIQEVGGGQEGALVEGSEGEKGEGSLSMLLECSINVNFFHGAHLVYTQNMCMLLYISTYISTIYKYDNKYSI